MNKLLLTALVLSSFLSCTTPTSQSSTTLPIEKEEASSEVSLKGKTYYFLSIMSAVQIQEVQFNFISDNEIQGKTSLSADINDCLNYINTPSLLETSKTYRYSYSNNTLEIPDLNVYLKVKEFQGQNIAFENNTIFYPTSIVEHLNSLESIDRINAVAPESTAKFYIEYIHNDNRPTNIITYVESDKGFNVKQPIHNPDKNKDNHFKTRPHHQY